MRWFLEKNTWIRKRKSGAGYNCSSKEGIMITEKKEISNNLDNSVEVSILPIPFGFEFEIADV